MGSAAPSLHANMLYSVVANAVFALTQWGIVIAAARFGTPSDVGVITIVTALVTPVYMFAQMSMRDGIVVDDLSRYSRADYVALRILSSGIATLIVLVLILTYLAPSGPSVQATAVAYAVVKLIGAQTNLNHGIFQRAERSDLMAFSIICRGVFGLTCFVVAFWICGSLAAAFAFEAVAWGVCLVLVDFRLLEQLDGKVTLQDLRAVPPVNVLRLMRWMLPLGIAVFLMNAANSVPRLILERQQGLAAVGVFGAIAYINMALNTFSGAIGTASGARLRRHFRDERSDRFLSLSLRLTLLSAGLGLLFWTVAWLAGEQILRILYGAEFARVDLFQVLIFAAALRIASSPLQFAMNAGQAFWLRTSNNALVFGISLIVSWMLIPAHGVVGAAWTVVLISAVNLILSGFSFLRLWWRMPSPIKNCEANSNKVATS